MPSLGGIYDKKTVIEGFYDRTNVKLLSDFSWFLNLTPILYSRVYIISYNLIEGEFDHLSPL